MRPLYLQAANGLAFQPPQAGGPAFDAYVATPPSRSPTCRARTASPTATGGSIG